MAIHSSIFFLGNPMDREVCRLQRSYKRVRQGLATKATNIFFKNPFLVKSILFKQKYLKVSYTGYKTLGSHFHCFEEVLERGVCDIPASTCHWLILQALELDRIGLNLHHLLAMPPSVSSVAQLCPTLCELMDCSKPGLPVHHQLLEFTQTHVH